MISPNVILDAMPAPFLGIPSPDLVLGFFASAAQILGLLSLTVLGVASARRRKAGAEGRPNNPWPLRVTAGLLIAVSAAFLLYHARQVDSDRTRMRATLFRPSVEAGKSVGDTNLKTLSLSGQSTHAHGVPLETLAADLEAGNSEWLLVDVREEEEVERGRIHGAAAIRYPDLLAQPEQLPDDQPVILMCFSGNRSSELCDELRKKGKDAHFLVGGYERWMAMDQDLDIPEGITRGSLRDLESYPNKDRLLTTEETAALIADERALVLDVRYPEDADRTPFPGAEVLPLRKMTSAQVKQSLADLPSDRPLLVACYDKRGSFYGSILGLRLHRAGLDFRGRFTTPWEYFVPKDERSYVAAWKDRNSGLSLLGLVAQPLEGALTWLNSQLANLGLAIVLLVLALRLALLPISARIDRDQQVQRTLEARLAQIKAEHGKNPKRWARETRQLHAANGLRPVRNMLGTMFQVLLFVTFFMVVNRTATGSTQTFLWLGPLGEPDATRVLPTLVGALVAAHVLLGQRLTLVRSGGAIASAVAFGWLTWDLHAAINLYLVTNLTLLVCQGRLVRLWITRQERRAARLARGNRRIVPLADAHLVPGCGKKAERLGRMLAAGLPVPDGFVITDAALSGDGPPELTAADQRTIRRLWKQLGAENVAVRSSGVNEDGADQSYAGVFESLLNITRETFDSAVHEVWESLRADRVSAYSGLSVERGAILVQAMVDARYAGVLFTEHPDHAGSMVVEMAEGLGDRLVSGQVTPTTHSFGRHTGRLLDSEQPPIDCAELLELGKRAESAFGGPQDLEWAWVESGFQLVQCRDVTALTRRGKGRRAIIEGERHRLLACAHDSRTDDVVFEQNELAEILPQPTPMSLALMQQLWDDGGATDLACAEMGLPWKVQHDSRPTVETAFGSLFVNRAEERRRLGNGPGAMSAFRMSRALDTVGTEWSETDRPGMEARMRFDEVLDLSRLDLHELIELFGTWRTRFVTDTYVAAERVNLAADWSMKAAERELRKQSLDPAVHLAHAPQTVVNEAMATLRNNDVDHAVAAFTKLFGHRAPLDFELSQPRYGENEELVRSLALASATAAAPTESEPPPPTGDRRLDQMLERARRFQSLKEEAKHVALRDLAGLRRLLLDIASRLELGDAIFQLHPEEIAQLEDASFRDEVLDLTQSRTEEAKTLRALDLPTRLTIKDLESFDPDAELSTDDLGDGLSGLRIAGEGEVRGRVRVLHDASEMGSFQDGEILVGRFTDPTWSPLFPRSRGIITEVGGWLSHAAIQAREYNITGIVGVDHATRRLRTGDLVQLRQDGGIEVLDDERRHERLPAGRSVPITLNGTSTTAELLDVSASGARLRCSGADLDEGHAMRIRLNGTDITTPGRIVRAGGDGTVGVRFDEVLVKVPVGATIAV